MDISVPGALSRVDGSGGNWNANGYSASEITSAAGQYRGVAWRVPALDVDFRMGLKGGTPGGSGPNDIKFGFRYNPPISGNDRYSAFQHNNHWPAAPWGANALVRTTDMVFQVRVISSSQVQAVVVDGGTATVIHTWGAAAADFPLHVVANIVAGALAYDRSTS